ncbi:MAG: hypothetical protein VX589_00645 [Myxococcota bacterium]|nr:hypothetical protein [Myxococcota bacterium]
MTESKSPVDDLFGDEELPVGHQPETPTPPRKRSNRLFIAGGALIAVALFWYLADRHHDHFYLVVDESMVHVERGYFFPVGRGDWAPSRAYEPFRIPKQMTIEPKNALSAKQLDAELLDIYMRIAKTELSDISNGDPDFAEDMIWRAQKLRSTSVADDKRSFSLLGDVAFRRGLTEVRSIQARFDEALEHFNMAAMRGGHVYKGARVWVDAISRLRAEFRNLALSSGVDPDLILPVVKGTGQAEGLTPSLAPPPADVAAEEPSTPESPSPGDAPPPGGQTPKPD